MVILHVVPRNALNNRRLFRCRPYLAKDRGWFGGVLDLSHLPVGNQDFGGVPYVIRDFRTSPLPLCAILAGPGARGQLPTAVQGLRANCKADVLFFLHTFNRTGQWRRGQPTDPTPVLFKYMVHYADGEQAEEQAVVYQFTWNNPRPDVAIATTDLEYGDQSSRYGTPALLAITAATRAE